MFYYNALLTKVKTLIYLGKIKDGVLIFGTHLNETDKQVDYFSKNQ